MKSYTDIEQSKKLAEILPPESADMYYWLAWSGSVSEEKRNTPKVGTPNKDAIKTYWCPCWSLASLFNVLPVIIGDVLSENALRLRIDKSETNFNVWYDNIDTGMVEEGFDIIESNPVDACYEMIIRLNEQNLL